MRVQHRPAGAVTVSLRPDSSPKTGDDGRRASQRLRGLEELRDGMTGPESVKSEAPARF